MDDNFNSAKMLFEKGEENFKKKDYKNAEKNFYSSLNFLPNRVSTLINLGLTKIKLRKIQECQKIINLIEKNNDNSSNLDFLNLKSLYFGQSNNFNKAINALDLTLLLLDKSNKKKISEIYSFKGIAFSQLGDHEKSIYFQKKAIQTDPNNIFAKFYLGIKYLKISNYSDGWKYYEHRINKNNWPKLRYPKDTEDLKLKKILIKSEQGIGDIIQFSRFITMLEKYSKDIDFLIPESLNNLFKFDHANLIFKKEKEYDYEIYLCSLPFLLKIEEKDLLNLRYDNFNFKKKEQRKLNKKINIGIAWSGSYSYKFDYLRSLDLKDLQPLIDNPKINLICLQRDIRSTDLDYFNQSGIKNLGNLNFSEISGKILNLDLVISSCTSLLHLSSSLNVETWAMLPFSSDWRWIDKRTDSPWYKKLKIYQKSKNQDWHELVRAINDQVNKKFF